MEPLLKEIYQLLLTCADPATEMPRVLLNHFRNNNVEVSEQFILDCFELLNQELLKRKLISAFQPAYEYLTPQNVIKVWEGHIEFQPEWFLKAAIQTNDSYQIIYVRHENFAMVIRSKIPLDWLFESNVEDLKDQIISYFPNH